ncbi:hypothetical protein MTO96_033118 [Rhipicephalus appendiculatus]
MEPLQGMQGVTTSQRPMARPSRRVRFMLPNGCVECPRRVELASSDTVILATGADTARKRAAPEPSSEPATLKRYVYRGGIPLKRFKGFHRIDSTVLRRTSGRAADTSSPEDLLVLRRLRIDASPDKAATSQAVSENDGFMDEILAMAQD